jgi:hypothetical protein
MSSEPEKEDIGSQLKTNVRHVETKEVGRTCVFSSIL